MIILDNSGIAVAGKQQEYIAALKEFAAYMDQHWPAAQPRQLWADTTGEVGRIHFVSVSESMLAYEQMAAAWEADPHRQALRDKIAPLMLPGSHRRTDRRVL